MVRDYSSKNIHAKWVTPIHCIYHFKRGQQLLTVTNSLLAQVSLEPGDGIFPLTKDFQPSLDG